MVNIQVGIDGYLWHEWIKVKLRTKVIDHGNAIDVFKNFDENTFIHHSVNMVIDMQDADYLLMYITMGNHHNRLIDKLFPLYFLPHVCKLTYIFTWLYNMFMLCRELMTRDQWTGWTFRTSIHSRRYPSLQICTTIRRLASTRRTQNLAAVGRIPGCPNVQNCSKSGALALLIL